MIRFSALAALVLLSGCTSFELAGVRNDLARQLPEAEIGEGYSMAFGGLSLGLARWLTGFADDEGGEMAALVLEDVRRVRFGRYDVNGTVDGRRLAMPGRLRRYVERDDWIPLAAFRQQAEAGWILYREDGDTITDLFAVVLNQEELILARISGDLSAVVMNVIREQGLPGFGPDESDEDDEALGEAAVEAAASMQ